MLMNPVHLRSTNPVLSDAEHPVYPGILADCTMIGIMLNI